MQKTASDDISTAVHVQERVDTDRDTAAGVQEAYAALAKNLEGLLAAAQPRLLRLARLNGVVPDAMDDVLQETLIEAWRHLNQLRTLERFDAWLDGICRNTCRRWARAHGVAMTRQMSLSRLFGAGDGSEEHGYTADVADEHVPDPADELNQQDLAILVDRALSYLPTATRELVELCYLQELPQREAAQRLGLTISALEARLHRARQQLRQVLTGELRADAEAADLALDQEEAQGWRASRQWCWLCGRHRLLGLFERHPDGGSSLRMRCPECSPIYDDIVHALPSISLGNLTSFRPAIKRVMLSNQRYVMQALTNPVQPCLCCGTPTWVQLLAPGERNRNPFQRSWTTLVLSCPAYGKDSATAAVIGLLAHPEVFRFFSEHGRSHLESETSIEFGGQPAMRYSLVDLESSARLTVIAHAQTLKMLALFYI